MLRFTSTPGRNHARPLWSLLKGPLLAGAALESPPFRRRLRQVGALSGLVRSAETGCGNQMGDASRPRLHRFSLRNTRSPSDESAPLWSRVTRAVLNMKDHNRSTVSFCHSSSLLSSCSCLVIYLFRCWTPFSLEASIPQWCLRFLTLPGDKCLLRFASRIRRQPR